MTACLYVVYQGRCLYVVYQGPSGRARTVALPEGRTFDVKERTFDVLAGNYVCVYVCMYCGAPAHQNQPHASRRGARLLDRRSEAALPKPIGNTEMHAASRGTVPEDAEGPGRTGYPQPMRLWYACVYVKYVCIMYARRRWRKPS